MAQISEQIRRRVIAAREELGLGPDDLAQALSLQKNSYAHYERGRSPFTVEQLFTLAPVLRKPITWLLGIEDPQGEARRIAELWSALPPDQRRIVTTILQGMVDSHQEQQSA